MLAPEDRERARENIGRLLRGEKWHGTEYRAQRKDSSSFPIIIYASPIIYENRPIGLRGIIIDITQRKKAEEEKEKLQV